MALPSISTPEFITKIPSTGQSVKYRPFLVKEEKILLMALEGSDEKEISSAILKLLESCILDDVDVNELATFDIEFLFLKLRGKSVGEMIELTVGHPNPENECQHRSTVQVNIDDINVKGEISDGKIMITDTVGVKLNYPTMEFTKIKNINSAEGMFEVISKSIEYIFDEEEVYNDFTNAEINDWLGTLNQGQFKKITDFFEDMPKLSHTIEWTCPACNEKDSMELEGMQTFFT
jgi:hypothetical protein